MSPPKLSAIAIAAHPDDIEYMMAGTLCLLKEAGYQTHYLNVATGSGGLADTGIAATGAASMYTRRYRAMASGRFTRTSSL